MGSQGSMDEKPADVPPRHDSPAAPDDATPGKGQAAPSVAPHQDRPGSPPQPGREAVSAPPRSAVVARPREDARPGPSPAKAAEPPRATSPVAAPPAQAARTKEAGAARAPEPAAPRAPQVGSGRPPAPSRFPIAFDSGKAAEVSGELARTKELLTGAVKANEVLMASIAAAQTANDAASARMREEHQGELARLAEEHASAIAKLKGEHATSAAFQKSDPTSPARSRANAPRLGLLFPVLVAGIAGAAIARLPVFDRSAPGSDAPESPAASATTGSATASATTGSAPAAPSGTPEGLASAALAASATPQEGGEGVNAAGEEPKTKTKTRMAGIAHTLEIDGVDHELPQPDRFGDYIRKNTPSTDGDPSNDAWGTPYRLDIPPRKTGVRSAGPDRSFDTADDIVVGVEIATK
jgi:hypothetical protein